MTINNTNGQRTDTGDILTGRLDVHLQLQTRLPPRLGCGEAVETENITITIKIHQRR